MASLAGGGTSLLTASSTPPPESSDHGISAKTLKLRIKDRRAAVLRRLRAGSGDGGAFKRRGSAMAA